MKVKKERLLVLKAISEKVFKEFQKETVDHGCSLSESIEILNNTFCFLSVCLHYNAGCDREDVKKNILIQLDTIKENFEMASDEYLKFQGLHEDN